MVLFKSVYDGAIEVLVGEVKCIKYSFNFIYYMDNCLNYQTWQNDV